MNRWQGLPTETRFWPRVRKAAGDACWTWLGHVSREGYGRIRVGDKQIGTHRAAWMLTNGPIPAGLHVCHRCDNPVCVRPDHLFLGGNADNVADRHRKGRSAGPRGERHASAKLTAAQVLEIRRRCAAGELQRMVGADYGIRQTTVSEIVLRHNWRDI